MPGPDSNPPPGATAPAGATPRVLVACPAEDARAFVARALAGRCAVEGASDGDTLRAARRHPPDLILADPQLLRELRSDPAVRSIPTLLFGDRLPEPDSAPEADDFLAWPVSERELRARVGLHLELARLRREAEARAVRERLETVLAGSSEAFAVFDPGWRCLFLNDRAAEMARGRKEELLGRVLWEVFPDTVGGPAHAAMCRAMAAREPARFEYHYPRFDRWFEFRAVPVPEGLAVFVTDVTDRKRAEEALRASEERFRLAAGGEGFTLFEQDAGLRYVWLHPRRPEFPDGNLGKTDAELLPPGEGEALVRLKRRVLETGEGLRREVRVSLPGGVRWYDLSVEPRRDPAGRVVGVAGVAMDVTERKLAEERHRFLAEAGQILGSSLDYETTLADVCRLAVPVLADWCALDLAGDDGEIRRLAVAHTDPAKVELAHELWRRYPPRPDDPRGLMRVLRTGEPELYPDISDRMLVEGSRDAEHLRIARELGLKSALVVPLMARGRTLGALTLVTAESGRHYGPDDLRLAEELAGRAALAVDNARLFAEAGEALRHRDAALLLHRTIEEQLTLLVEASGSLSRSLAPAETLAAVLALSRRLVPADAYAVWRYRPETGRWGIEASEGLSEAYRSAGIQMLERTPKLSDEPVIADDVRSSPMLADRQAGYVAEGIESLLAVPLRVRGELCGTIVFYHRRPHRFTPVEVRVATALANLAGGAIGTAELYEAQSRMRAEAESARQRLAFLADASAALSATLNEEVTLQGIACLAVPELADWCVVDLFAEDGSVRRIAGRHSDPSKDPLLPELLKHYPHDYRPEERFCVPEVHRTGAPEVVNEVTEAWLRQSAASAEHARILGELGLGSYMVVPLVARRRALGSISFASVRPNRYGPAELALAEDLARRAALAVDNARLYREARDADRRKDEFLAMLAHELRNPLAPIRNAVRILKLPEGARPPLEEVRGVVERQVEHLVRMVDDLLDVSRLLRGKVELRTELVDLSAAVLRAAETAQPAIDARGHRLEVSLPEKPVYLLADLVRLAQVFGNLLHNAAKYTPEAGRIWLSADREGAEAVVRVRDTGSGIAPELLPRVFELFVQGDRSPARSQGGLGIGLTLVRHLVEMHGGRVAATSAGPGRGSELIVRLPVLAEPPAQAVAVEGGGGSAAVAPCKVLVVDDNVDAAESLAFLLRSAGHTVCTAHSGPEALEAAAAFRPEVAVLDIGLPGMDGYEVARRLRGTPGLEGVGLLAVTGYGQDADRQRSREAGFDRHLVKPIDPDELLGILAAGVRG